MTNRMTLSTQEAAAKLTSAGFKYTAEEVANLAKLHVFAGATKDNSKGIWQIPEEDIDRFIKQRQREKRLRWITAGSVLTFCTILFATISGTKDGLDLLKGYFLPATKATPTSAALPLATYASATTTPIPSSDITPSPTPTEESSLIASIPTAGAQLDFSPLMDIDPIKFPEESGFRPSPYSGIYLSELYVERETAESWIVYYEDGQSRPAETDVCLTNIHQASSFQGGPLNVKVSRVTLDISIYADYRYSYQINDLDISIVDFVSQRTDIDYVLVGLPRAGGWGGPFQIVRTSRLFVEGKRSTVYKVDFQDFVLKPVNGVRILVPVTMMQGGDYQFLLKVNGIATPVYNGEPGGNLTLTTDQKAFGWVRIDDPRKYTVRGQDFTGKRDLPVELVPCR